MQQHEAGNDNFQKNVGMLLNRWGREARRRAKHANAWIFFDSKRDEAARLGVEEHLRVVCSQAADHVINTRRSSKKRGTSR